VDDVVDEIVESGGGGHARELAQVELNKWRAEIDNLYAGHPAMPLSQKLETVLERFPMPKEYFLEMISGCEMDLQRSRYETFDDLYQYCYRVAAITGLMCIEIFTYRSPTTQQYAVNLGIALQLTNILRDVKEDAERGRIYLPQEDLRRFGYSENDLVNGVVNDNFRALMKFECDRARRYYQLANDGRPDEDRATLTAARTMGKIYFRLLEQIERFDYDVFNHQVRLHRPERFYIALSEWLRATARAGDEESGRRGDGESEKGEGGEKER
jgi:phytoene synthase